MSTSQSTADFIVDQLDSLAGVASRKMFGEYALYYGGKVVALICDDLLFVKITEAGKAFVGERYEEGYPYEGAKSALLIEEDYLQDKAWLSELIELTAAALPMPKKKKG